MHILLTGSSVVWLMFAQVTLRMVWVSGERAEPGHSQRLSGVFNFGIAASCASNTQALITPPFPGGWGGMVMQWFTAVLSK